MHTRYSQLLNINSGQHKAVQSMHVCTFLLRKVNTVDFPNNQFSVNTIFNYDSMIVWFFLKQSRYYTV